MIFSVEKNTALVKHLCKDHGFDYCGISKAEFLEKEAKDLESWLSKNYNGKMAYMANHFDKRLDPRLLVPGAKSVISLMLNYYPEKDLAEDQTFKISKYAYGQDYHEVIKAKMKALVQSLKEKIGDFDGRVFVDSAPVMDKAWAKRSGIGWIGKNTNIINKESGSFFFIAELISDLDLIADGPIKDYCGTCTACLDACPTDALVAPYQIDGSKCISYFTIELKEEIPADVKGKFEGWAFGCDICQDVCPWNSFSKPHKEEAFKPNSSMLKNDDWKEITEEVFQVLFKNSPIKRTKLAGLKRNLKFLETST